MSKKIISYSEMIGQAITSNMKKNNKIFISGLEIDYSSKVFGSLNKPFEEFPSRFVQTPAMENGLCTILAGSAINGMRPIFVNNRCDFLLLAFDPIVNIIDKWNYMFDGNAGNCPIVITAVIGRGWGQGATHSQSFHNFFSRLSGINVFLPTFPSDVSRVYNYALKTKKASIILHHRGLFKIKEKQNFSKKFCLSNIIKKGKDLAIITFSYGSIQSLQVSNKIEKKFGRKITILNLVSLNPLDKTKILRVAKNHKNILLLDIDHDEGGINDQIFNIIKTNFVNKIIKKIGYKKIPAPAAESLEKLYYPSNQVIYDIACKLLQINHKKNKIKTDYNFVGPY
tara:strand:+ start:1736 stop:2755 length:1020 start_codon:yes stop_codon:yes gene_type:complete